MYRENNIAFCSTARDQAGIQAVMLALGVDISALPGGGKHFAFHFTNYHSNHIANKLSKKEKKFRKKHKNKVKNSRQRKTLSPTL